MKVLFLDFDGVLNSLEYCFLRKPDDEFIVRFDPRLIEMLNFVCREIPELKIVISSSWRKINTLDAIKELLSSYGFLYTETIIDKTPSLNTIRGFEIEDYCTKYNITQYCIVDDDRDMLESQMKNFVRTDDVVGLTFYDALKIIHILNPDNQLLLELMDEKSVVARLEKNEFTK